MLTKRLASYLVALLVLLAISCLPVPSTVAEDTGDAESTTTSDAVPLSKPLEQPEAWQNELIQWLISKPNGYFSDKILWTKTEMGYNMHAAVDIPKDTTLMIIPQAALITSDGTEEECVTISKMIKEYEKGTGSEFYPYIRYLFGGHEGGTSPNLLPTTWSKKAKDLLLSMLGTELYPRNIEKGQSRVLQDCENFLDAKTLEKVDDMDEDTRKRWQDAYIYWLSRSWTDKMVPILDMINHRNGNWLNVESTTAHSGEDITVYALRDIAKGEQLWNSYSECLDEDCAYGQIKYSYVTQHILMDYGFVEGYPRRFVFHVDEEGGKRNRAEFLVVEIDEDPNDSSKKLFEWHFRAPSHAQLHWIRHQLARLKGMENNMKKGLEELPEGHERSTIEAYYNAYMEALELAMVHKDDEESDNTSFPDLEDDEEEEEDDGDEL